MMQDRIDLVDWGWTVRAAPWLPLLAVLAASTSAFAQGQDIAPGMITRAIEREVARLVAETDQVQSAPPKWSPVLKLTPGREIILTTVRALRSKHRLLKVDEVALTILNVADPAIPETVSRVLVSTAEKHPAYFADAQRGRGFVLEKGVRLGPDGVFHDERKLFEVEHIVETVPRDDVLEVSVLAKHIGRHAKRGALIGAIAGALMLGIGAGTCAPGTEPDYCNVAGMAALGALGGGLVGLEYGAIIGIVVPRSPDVIYRRD